MDQSVWYRGFTILGVGTRRTEVAAPSALSEVRNALTLVCVLTQLHALLHARDFWPRAPKVFLANTSVARSIDTELNPCARHVCRDGEWQLSMDTGMLNVLVLSARRVGISSRHHVQQTSKLTNCHQRYHLLEWFLIVCSIEAQQLYYLSLCRCTACWSDCTIHFWSTWCSDTRLSPDTTFCIARGWRLFLESSACIPRQHVRRMQYWYRPRPICVACLPRWCVTVVYGQCMWMLTLREMRCKFCSLPLQELNIHGYMSVRKRQHRSRMQ